MPDRYFVQQPIVGDQAMLVGPEAHHLIHVMRAKPGAEVILFDGSGAEFTAEVARVGRSDLRLRVLGRFEVDRELPFALTLGVALPKGDRQKWLVEKAVELGVGQITPLQTARSVAQPAPQALTRLRRSVIEASKQSGRNRLMQISEPLAWPEYVATPPEGACALLAHPEKDRPYGGSVQAATGDRQTQQPELPTASVAPPPDTPIAAGQAGRACFLAVGPEGGFTEDEVALATNAGWRLVDLGPRILRVETAAMAMAALAAQLGARQRG